MKKLLIVSTFLVSSLFAGGDRFHDYVKVKYSEPIYEYVYEQVPQTQCSEVRKKVRAYDNDSYVRNDNLGIDTLVGVAAGAVLGSQVGKGNGRVAAQIVGGLLGGKVAHEIRNNYNSNQSYRYVNTTECFDTYENVERKVITGYKNHFVYKGIKHYKITKRPKDRIKITHSISF
ncbi:glycine zipper 2TM domain-containing protein [Halarcobacter bivalviorum]|uniref:Glycine zipper 2TM domain-containing protein n=1 Tax=Halarcobacter bivalviorum TaxID=663364 RepID=A0AAX2AB10_9BACT|nr:glycine zipper 2TM domain-containing protein [Halarcobacter bivalviorum]AXH12455.1 glycine zipper 2TM domain-containing protein [Halarcobacter bivalviorum]RXK10619.1 hypothetical protein CRV05_04895 [Halarcobacter bivalviorum]